MAKVIKASIISAAVGASIGAVAVALSQKETRDKATEVLKDAKKQALNAKNQALDSANDLYKSVKPQTDKATADMQKAVKKTVTVKKK